MNTLSCDDLLSAACLLPAADLVICDALVCFYLILDGKIAGAARRMTIYLKGAL